MNADKLYAIVDIETTGAYAGGCRITEIAVIIHNGEKVLEDYQTLVNPQQDIPYHIQVLTGISNEMVSTAPVFEEIASDIFKLLHDKIFVAHNVNFDYSFVHSQLKENGYALTCNKLCTVRLARKSFKGLPSYSLGKLCHSLGIPLYDRHRAYGDASATALLFERILAADSDRNVDLQLRKSSMEHRLPPHLSLDDFKRLPECTGVYFFRNKSGKLIYVGKAVNIKKRVYSHFTGNNISARRQLFIKDIHYVDFEETGTELMALLKECHYIKQNWPVYNRALKKYEPKFGLIDYEDNNGYLRLCICKMNRGTRALKHFDNVSEATQCLLGLIDRFGLDTRFCVFFQNSNKQDRENILHSADGKQNALMHNQKVEEAIASLQAQHLRYAIIDKGRNDDERSYIYYTENRVFALGYISIHANDVDSIEFLIKQEDRCHSNFYMCQLVKKYALMHPHKHVNCGEGKFIHDITESFNKS